MPPNITAMEDIKTIKGVFLYTKYLDSEVMVRCQQTLLNNFPDIKFSSVVADEKFLGYRVHFSFPNEEVVLAKKCLTVSGQDIQICALTTCLTIHNVNSNEDDQSDSDIRDAVNNRFGKVLNIVNQTNNCRVFIDVPEVKDLKIFEHEGLTEMRMWHPNKKDNLKVSFVCKQCKKDGHIKEDCYQVMPQKPSIADERRISHDSNDASINLDMKNKIRQELTDTDSFAEKLGREEIMKTGILSEGDLNHKSAGPSTSTTNTTENFTSPINSIKKEIEENDNLDKIKDEIQNNENNNCSRVSKEEPSSMSVNDDTDEIQVVDEYPVSSKSTTAPRTPYKSEHKAGRANSDQELNSPTSMRPGEQTSFPSSSATPGPSNATHGSTRHSISVEVTSNLSVRLQTCIDRACEEVGVLRRQKLEAFLTHVKKKSNPIRVARNYTDYPLKLKELLQMILNYYYDVPETGTKEDIQFIKWLNGLVERFEGTVSRKRKRGGLNQSDTSAKK